MQNDLNLGLIDLHVHSTASDGTYSPCELVHYAKEKGLCAMALTDHDTVQGVANCIEEGHKLGIEIIPGIEFSADYYGKELHILGYGIDSNSSYLTNQLEALLASRSKRNEKMLAKLNELGFAITLEDCLKDTAPDTVLTRAHMAKALLEKGYITERKEAFSKYIGDGKPAYVPKSRFTAKACIDLIHQVGGIAVLAHPHLYGYDYKDLTQVIRGLVLDGLDGLEVYYTTHSKEDTDYLLQRCKQHQLIITGGSDFHGGNKPGLDLASGYGNLTIPSDLLIAIHEKLGSHKI